MTCAWRPAGAQRPAPSAGSPRGRSRPDRRSARSTLSARLSGFLPALALLFGALGSFTAAPASADVLVSNIGKNQGSITLAGKAYALGFTTGTHAAGYNLESIEAVFKRLGELPAGYASTIRAELWSDNNWKPSAKLADLTVPTNFAPGTVAFAAPTGTLLAAYKRYFLVIYTTGDLEALGVGRAGSASEDAGAASGWSIFDSGHYADSNTPGGTWPRHPNGILSIRVNGTEATRSTASEVTLSASPFHVVDEDESTGKLKIVATLDKPAPAGGVEITLKAENWGTASSPADYSLPAPFTIKQGETTGSAYVTIVNDKVDEGNETIPLTASAGGLVVNRLILWISDDDHALVLLNKGDLSLTEGALLVGDTAEYYVSLTTRPPADVTITATSSKVANATVDPASVTFTPDDWENRKTFTVTGVAVGPSTISHAVTSDDSVYASKSVDPVSVKVYKSNRTYSISSLRAAEEGTTPAVLILRLGRQAPEGGLSFNISYDYSGGSATAADTARKPSTLTVPQHQVQMPVVIYSAADDLVEGEETFKVTIATTTAGWAAASDGSDSVTAAITDKADYDAKIAFGDSAAATAKYTATVDEDVSGGTLNVPVTVSHLPGATTTFAVEVVEWGSATEYTDAANPGDYRIATKSVSFGPSDASKTKNLAIAITDDDDVEWLETIELRIAAADATPDDPGDLYGRNANGSKATITIDSEDPVLSEDSEDSEDPQLQQQQSTDPLTASFEQVPSEHDGAESFWINVRFSDALGAENYWGAQGEWPVAASFGVRGGTVKRVRRIDPDLWGLRIVPDSWRDVKVTLAGGRSCDETGAVCTPDGRALSDTVRATIGGPVRIRVKDARAREGKHESLDFAVSLNRAAAHEVSVDYATEDGTATAGSDYTATSGTLTFAAGETAKTVKVPVLDDAIDEGKETFKLKLSNPQGAFLRGIHREAKGVIRNDDALQKLWLSRFGRTVASQTVAALEGRFAVQADAPSHVTMAGVDLLRAGPGSGAALSETLTGLAQAFGAPSAPATDPGPFARSGLRDEPVGASAPARGMTARGLLAGSSFRFTTGGALDPGGAMTGWGKVVSGGSDGSSLAGLSYASETATGILGMDWERNRLLVGVALSRSLETGRAQEASGTRYDIEGELSTVAPYMRVQASERLSFWSALGSGEGSMALSWGGVSQKADISMQLAAAGGRAELLRPEAGGGFALALKGDAFFVRTESARVSTPGVGNLAASTGAASRVRAVLEGSRPFGLAGGGSLEPSLSLGLRHDGGDAETGTGMEAGMGLAWSDPARGLTSDIRLYGLAAHESGGYEEWGASGSLRMAPDPSGRGLSLSMTPSWGAQGQTGRLWSEAPKALAGTGGGEQPGGRLDTEVGYGLSALGGTGTPYAGLGLGDGGARDWRLGWRFTSERLHSLSLGVEATRREPANPGSGSGAGSGAEHGVTVSGALRW